MRKLPIDKSVKALIAPGAGKHAYSIDSVYVVEYGGGPRNRYRVKISASRDPGLVDAGRGRYLVSLGRYKISSDAGGTIIQGYFDQISPVYQGDDTTTAIRAFRKVAWTLGARYKQHEGASRDTGIERLPLSAAMLLSNLDADVRMTDFSPYDSDLMLISVLSLNENPRNTLLSKLMPHNYGDVQYSMYEIDLDE